VKDNNNLPKPEVLTSKIEETIDDLFKPTKQIEIDPLTQEVKEITSGDSHHDTEPEISFDLSFDETLEDEPKVVEEPKLEEAKAREEVPIIKEPDTKEDLELSLDELEPKPEPEIEPVPEPDDEIELELFEEETDELETWAEEESFEEVDETFQKLEKVREDLYTIEWEVSDNRLTGALTEIRELLEVPEIKSNENATSLLILSYNVLKQSLKLPEKMKVNAPSILKRTIEMVIDIYKGVPVGNAEVRSMKMELKTLLRPPKAKRKPTKTKVRKVRKPAPPKTKIQPEIKPDTDAVSDTGTSTEKLSFQDLKDSLDDLQTSHSSSLNIGPIPEQQEAKEILASHLQELQRQVNRILSLEKLLANTSGMEKLYKFQKNIRESLENEIARLFRYFFEPGGLELPTPASPGKMEREPELQKEHGCKWDKLLTLSIEGVEIGIPEEEVVYIGEPPLLSRNFIKKANFVPLSKLRPWPWSKISRKFSNKLTGIEERQLSKLSFPVVRNLDDLPLKVPPKFYILVLFDGENGCILLTRDTPILINVPQDAKYEKKRNSSFDGVVEIHGIKISVLTAKSVNRLG